MRKNAFTLIELLAVIVILAIIASIAVPIVLGMINDSKKSSEERSVDLYIDSIEKTITQENLKRKYSSNTCEIQEDGNLKCYGDIDNYTKDEILNLNVQGEKPTAGTIIIENGNVTDIFNLVLNGKNYTYDSNRKIKLLEVPTFPGLYDENYKLLASWDDLVSTYRLQVIDGKLKSGIRNIILNNNELKNSKLLIISSDVTSFDAYAFTDCDSLTSIIIPNSITRIPSNVFSNSSNLKSIIIPEGVTKIDSFAFENCTGLKSITIPSSVTYIDTYAFSNSSKNLLSIKVSSENTVYEDGGVNAIIEKSTKKLMLGCRNTTIPDNIITIAPDAFRGCEGLTSITIPSSVTSINNMAFYGCSDLLNVTILEGVQSIWSNVFGKCTSLKSITIPSSVTLLGDNILSGCTNLSSIKVSSGNTIYEDRDSNAIIRKSDDVLLSGCKNTIIPNTVKKINYMAFRGTGLTNIIIPDSVTYIGSMAFSECNDLKTVKIKNGVTTIDHRAFESCTNLTNVTFENTEGWFTAETSSETSGENMDVTNAGTNAINLKDTYRDKCWKRS